MSSTFSTYTPTTSVVPNPNIESRTPMEENLSGSFFNQYVSFSPLFIALIVLTAVMAFTVMGIKFVRERNRRRLAKKCTQETFDEYFQHAFENSPVNEALPGYSSAGCEPAVPEVVVQRISRQAYDNIIDIPDYQPSSSNRVSSVNQLPPAYDQVQETSYQRPTSDPTPIDEANKLA